MSYIYEILILLEVVKFNIPVTGLGKVEIQNKRGSGKSTIPFSAEYNVVYQINCQPLIGVTSGGFSRDKKKTFYL